MKGRDPAVSKSLPSRSQGLYGSGAGGAWRAPVILARAQRREVRPNIWASRRSESGLPARTLSRYAATAAALIELASSALFAACGSAWCFQ